MKKQAKNKKQQKKQYKNIKKIYTSTYPENKMRAHLLFPLKIRLSVHGPRGISNFRWRSTQ